jgi:hypothetical protein
MAADGTEEYASGQRITRNWSVNILILKHGVEEERFLIRLSNNCVNLSGKSRVL